VDAVFEPIYRAYDGIRLLGRAISSLDIVDGIPLQYFEKGRLEDHCATEARPEWRYQYGLLVDELVGGDGLELEWLPVGGDDSTVSYQTLADAADPAGRVEPPSGFVGGVARQPDGSAFVPFAADLSPAAGHVVPVQFWEYLSRADLFPGGWLHDVGLPITAPLEARVAKGVIMGTEVLRVTDRPITVQAFQRTVLTYDPENPEGWQVERANVGADYLRTFPIVRLGPAKNDATTATRAGFTVPDLGRYFVHGLGREWLRRLGRFGRE
jgi:hypothetical protein